MSFLTLFRGPPQNPHSEPEPIDSHPALWRAVHLIQVGQARLEERMRAQWLLGLAIFGAVVARWLGV